MTDYGAKGFRPLNEPAPLAVEATPRGVPNAVLWRGAFKPVAAIHETWRVDDEWWRPRRVSRLYFNLFLDDGRHLTVFHDLLSQEWYEQRYA